VLKRSTAAPAPALTERGLEIHFDLNRPCAECPFRRNAPPHEGVLRDLPKIGRHLKEGKFLHTCHRTDPRSDYEPARGYKGKLQHCAGALAMQVNEGTAMKNVLLVEQAIFSKRRFLPDELPKNPEVFGSLLEMFRHYMGQFPHYFRGQA
jgi:hypothetical protein